MTEEEIKETAYQETQKLMCEIIDHVNKYLGEETTSKFQTNTRFMIASRAITGAATKWWSNMQNETFKRLQALEEASKHNKEH
jgi:hypothetical protein